MLSTFFSNCFWCSFVKLLFQHLSLPFIKLIKCFNILILTFLSDLYLLNLVFEASNMIKQFNLYYKEYIQKFTKK